MRRWAPALVMLLLIAGATLRPMPPLTSPLPMFCLVCGDLGGVDVTLNIILFVPMGAALVWAGLSWQRAALACALLSFGIESLQFSLIPGRDASISDLLTNSIGGMLGATLLTHWSTVVLPSRAMARGLCAGATLLSLGAMAATAALLKPSTPNMGLWGQWAPVQPQFEPFTGVVRDFHLNGFQIPYNLVPEHEALRQSLLAGPRLGRVEIFTGAPTFRLAAIARVGSSMQEIMLFGQRKEDFVFRTRLAVRDWRLRTPAVAIPDAFPDPGVAVSLEGGLTQNGWLAAVRSARGEVRLAIPFSVGLGWSFFLPFEHPIHESDWWISSLWLAAMAAPVTYWGAMIRRAGSRIRLNDAVGPAAASAALASGLSLITMLSGFATPSASEWWGLGAGCALGILAAAISSAFASRRHHMSLLPPER